MASWQLIADAARQTQSRIITREALAAPRSARGIDGPRMPLPAPATTARLVCTVLSARCGRVSITLQSRESHYARNFDHSSMALVRDLRLTGGGAVSVLLPRVATRTVGNCTQHPRSRTFNCSRPRCRYTRSPLARRRARAVRTLSSRIGWERTLDHILSTRQ